MSGKKFKKQKKSKRRSSRSRSEVRTSRSHSRGGRSHSRGEISHTRGEISHSRDRRSRSHSRDRRSRSHSRDRRSRSHSRGRRSRSHSRGRRSRSHSRGRRSRSHSRGRRSRSHSRGRRSRSHSRGRRSRSHSRGRISRSHSRGRISRSHSRGRISRSHSRGRRSRSHSRDRRSRSHSRDRRSGSHLRDRRSRSYSRRRRSRSYSRRRRSRSYSRRRRSRSYSRRRRSRSYSRRRSSSYSKEKVYKKQKSYGIESSKYYSRNRNTDAPNSSNNFTSNTFSTGDNKLSFESRMLSSNAKYCEEKPWLNSSQNINAAKLKGVFVETLGSYVRLEYVMYTDQKGDKKNFSFNATHYTELAKYNGFKFPMGVSESKSKSSHTAPVRYYQKKAAAQLDPTPTTVRPYLELLSAKSDEALKEYVPMKLSYSETVRITKSANDVKSLNGGGDALDCSQFLDVANYTNINKKFNEKLSANPKDVELWLNFVKFQDEYFCHSYDGGCESSASNQNALLERKLSLLDKAIENNKKSMALHLERLNLGENYWSKETLNAQWSNFLNIFQNDLDAWNKFILHQSTTSQQYKLSHAVEACLRCCESIKQIGKSNPQKLNKDANLAYVDVIYQVCCIWSNSGHRERSIALWQALIEYNLYALESDSKLSDEDKLPVFEQFWDTRASRFGEKDSLGWREALKQRQIPIHNDQEILRGQFDIEDKLIGEFKSSNPLYKTYLREEENEEENLENETEDKSEIDVEKAEREKLECQLKLSELWVSLETAREKRHWLPYDQDPDDCEDSERIVDFDAIAKFVTTLNFDHSNGINASPDKKQTTHFYLLVKFLQFLGVPQTESDRNWLKLLGIEVNDDLCDTELQDFSPIFSDVKILKLSDDFSESDKILPSVSPSYIEDDSLYSFIVNVIEKAIVYFSYDEYSSFFGVVFTKILSVRAKFKLSFKGANKKSIEKVSKKTVKKLLSQEKLRNNTLVFLQYGKLEELFGNILEAQKIYLSLLSSHTNQTDVFSFGPIKFHHFYEVFISYINSNIEASKVNANSLGTNLNAIKEMIVNIVMKNSGEVSASDFLRTKSKLAELLKANPIQKNDRNFHQHRILLVFSSMLQFTNGGLTDFCNVYDSTIDGVRENATLHGFIMEDYAYYCYKLNKLKDSISPLTLRLKVQEALSLRPHSTLLLALMSRLQNWRSLFHGCTGCTPTQFLFRIMPHLKTAVKLSEIDDQSIPVASNETLQSVLKRSVSSSSHCPLLWRLYLQMAKRTSKPQLISTALNACPGSKSVYLSSVAHRSLSLENTLKLMEEREVRVRLPLQELTLLLQDEEQCF